MSQYEGVAFHQMDWFVAVVIIFADAQHLECSQSESPRGRHCCCAVEQPLDSHQVYNSITPHLHHAKMLHAVCSKKRGTSRALYQKRRRHEWHSGTVELCRNAAKLFPFCYIKTLKESCLGVTEKDYGGRAATLNYQLRHRSKDHHVR
jgi:hypothetical protein